ncbi:hypothetical protein LTR53_004327 [Teratosphaeriaceae sp. CCFEE 6253]|nr:hypothetical protein LTR53_004327 [Teratosphaeriaceae sp. CCFEE 6253]
MPAWRGWSEFDVRRSTGGAAPATPGFTPINASASTAGAAYIKDPTRLDASSAQVGHDPSTSIASQHLGRDETELSAPVATEALCGTGAKKGKKRASTTTAPNRSKRQKSGDVSEILTISKPAVRGDDSSNSASVKKGAPTKKNAESMSAPKRKRKRAHDDEMEQSEASETATELTRPMPVYSQITTMDAVPLAAQPTTVDALKGSLSHGTTLYSSDRACTVRQQNVSLGKLMLATAKATGKTTAVSAKIPMSVNETHAQTTHAANEQRLEDPRTRRHSRLSPVLEEDVFDLDLDLPLESLAQSFDEPAGKEMPKTNAQKQAQLPTPVSSDAAAPSTSGRKQPARKTKKPPPPPVQTEEDSFFLDDSDDDAMVDAAGQVEEAAPPRSPTQPHRDRKLNLRIVEADDDYGDAFLTETEKQLLGEIQARIQHTEKRIVRFPFPPPLLDRSPLFGASNSTVLRVCFRIGEALNASSAAVRTHTPVLLELYARVTESRRDEVGKPGRRHQDLVFRDLYHDKPPYLVGRFDLWDQSRLWELDSRVFLTPRNGGRMCRVVGRMKREGGELKLEVLGIWEAGWADVRHVTGIYAKSSGGLVDGSE